MPVCKLLSTHTLHMVKLDDRPKFGKQFPRVSSAKCSFVSHATHDEEETKEQTKDKTKEEALTLTCSLLSSVKALTSCILSLSSRRTTLTASLKKKNKKTNYACLSRPTCLIIHARA